MKLHYKLYSLILLFFCVFNMRAQHNGAELKTTEINGKEYYIYEVKKGETLYNIANRMGWDYDELAELNENVLSDFKKGTILYYPAGLLSSSVTNENISLPEPGPILEKSLTLEPIVHKVQKGESVYGIAHRYGIPLEEIYDQYPSTRQGVKKGDVLIFQQKPERIATGFYYYTVRKGDQIPLLARDFNTTEENIIKNNPALAKRGLKTGEIIRIKIVKFNNMTNSQLASENENNEDSPTIVDINELDDEDKEVEITDLVIQIPRENLVETVDKNQENEEITELEVEGIQEIVEDVDTESSEPMLVLEEVSDDKEEIDGENNDLDNVEKTITKTNDIVNVILLLDDPTSKKDIEFSRGFLLALKNMGDPEYKLNFKILDGRVSSNELVENFDDFEPTMIISTADKAFPAFLADYGNTNDVQIINVFDVKNDLYEDNSSLIQLMPSSELFNEMIAEFILDNYNDKKLIIIGPDTEIDGIAKRLMNGFDDEDILKLSSEDFIDFKPENEEDYLIYNYVSGKNEISTFLKNLEKLNLTNNSQFTVVGKPNWIVYNNDFETLYNNNKIIIPSRVMMAASSPVWDKFSALYTKSFGGKPLKSYPNFAASGFDTATYFVPLIAKYGNEIEGVNDIIIKNPLQITYNLKRVNNWSGFINDRGFLVKYNKSGLPEFIELQ